MDISSDCERSASSGMISSLNEASILKYSVTMTCDFAVAQLLVELFYSPSFTHKDWVNLRFNFQALSKIAAFWDHLPRTILSRSHISDESTMVRFEPGSYCWKVNVLTSPPHTHINKHKTQRSGRIKSK